MFRSLIRCNFRDLLSQRGPWWLLGAFALLAVLITQAPYRTQDPNRLILEALHASALLFVMFLALIQGSQRLSHQSFPFRTRAIGLLPVSNARLFYADFLANSLAIFVYTSFLCAAQLTAFHWRPAATAAKGLAVSNWDLVAQWGLAYCAALSIAVCARFLGALVPRFLASALTWLLFVSSAYLGTIKESSAGQVVQFLLPSLQLYQAPRELYFNHWLWIVVHTLCFCLLLNELSLRIMAREGAALAQLEFDEKPVA